MIEFLNRVPETGKANRKKIIHEDTGIEEYAIIENADDPVEQGTPIDRMHLMAAQGFVSKRTVFDKNGNIIETNGEGQILETSFNSDGTITEEFKGNKTVTRKTTFNADGSITEEVY